MDFRWISAGELAKDQWVTVLGLKPQLKHIIVPTGEKIEIMEEDKNPYIKGIPFRILDVKLPLVMLHNITRAPNIPLVVFHDTRLVEFLEVDQDYAVLYQQHMHPPLPPPQQVVIAQGPTGEIKMIKLGEPDGTPEDDGQGTFKFTPPDEDKGKDEGNEGGSAKKDDDDEDGPPPLVPV